MCAERRLAEIRGVPEPVRRKAPGWRCEGCQEAPKKLEGKGEKKKGHKKKKLSAERRRLIESHEDERRKAPVHLALHLCSTLSEAFTSNQ